jgi:hypothetical protein
MPSDPRVVFMSDDGVSGERQASASIRVLVREAGSSGRTIPRSAHASRNCAASKWLRAREAALVRAWRRLGRKIWVHKSRKDSEGSSGDDGEETERVMLAPEASRAEGRRWRCKSEGEIEDRRHSSGASDGYSFSLAIAKCKNDRYLWSAASEGKAGLEHAKATARRPFERLCGDLPRLMFSSTERECDDERSTRGDTADWSGEPSAGEVGTVGAEASADTEAGATATGGGGDA